MDTNNVEWVFLSQNSKLSLTFIITSLIPLARCFLVYSWSQNGLWNVPLLSQDSSYSQWFMFYQWWNVFSKFLVYLTSSSNIVSGLTLCQLLMRSNMFFLFSWSSCNWQCRTSAIDDLSWTFISAVCFWTKMSNSLFICSARTSWWNPLKGILPNSMNSSVTPKLQMSAGFGRNGFCVRTSGGR